MQDSFKIDIGDPTEDAVQKGVEDAFSSDFVFRSPRREGGKEVTDVLVLYDDVGLVIQAKAKAVDPNGNEDQKSIDWAGKNLKKAFRQTKGAIRAIREGRMTFVENRRRGRIPFQQSEFPCLYGLIVLHQRAEPYLPQDLVPEIKDCGFPLHVLSFSDFANLANYLDTPIDLVNYFEARSDVLIPMLNPRVHEEINAFVYFFDRLEEIMALRAKARGEGDGSTEPFKPYAVAMRSLVFEQNVDTSPGLVIDDVINRLHEQDPDLEAITVGGKETPRNGMSVYPRIATELNKIPRVRRIALGRQFLRIAKLAAEKNESHHVLTHSPSRSDCILFMASPLPKEERKQRLEELLCMTTLGKTYHQVHRAIGICTEPAGRMGSSYDVVFLEHPPTPDKEGEELGRKVFGEPGPKLLN